MYTAIRESVGNNRVPKLKILRHIRSTDNRGTYLMRRCRADEEYDDYISRERKPLMRFQEETSGRDNEMNVIRLSRRARCELLLFI